MCTIDHLFAFYLTHHLDRREYLGVLGVHHRVETEFQLLQLPLPTQVEIFLQVELDVFGFVGLHEIDVSAVLCQLVFYQFSILSMLNCKFKAQGFGVVISDVG